MFLTLFSFKRKTRRGKINNKHKDMCVCVLTSMDHFMYHFHLIYHKSLF